MGDSTLWFDRPEDATSGWPTAAHVRVVSVDVRGNRAEIVLDTDPHYPYWVYCVQSGGRWRTTVDGNGPCTGWDDPEQIQWAD
jgi:hypothetical protein